MRGGPAIEAFAEKLRLALGRANLSRAQLAQAIEVDKSVVSRWLNGALQPSDHSLTALTAVLAKSLPRFDRLTWDGTATEFAQRLGVGTATLERAAGDFPILPRAKETMASNLAFAEERYAALWMLVFPSPTLNGGIVFLPMRIGWLEGAGFLPIEWVYRPLVHMRGAAFELGGWLYGVLEGQVTGTPGFLALEGVPDEEPLLLDGLMTARRSTAIATMYSARVLAFRLGRLPDEAAFTAIGERAVACTRGGAGVRLPEALHAAFRMPETSATKHTWLVHEPAQSWTTGETRRNDPARAPQMEALAAVRGLFADLLPTKEN
ncbi:helix-turn-helix transcriptional regulator [Roseomonas sp. HF4]|uniref:helix-turn-helix domain-containing protein n=1 Tax=Roseomonas sp. HF4 TaxID=2562313 RepID=UPI0010C03169|nr:helix-turn-helix transcriptional regulator [Roseomonas sp. HF4]